MTNSDITPGMMFAFPVIVLPSNEKMNEYYICLATRRHGKYKLSITWLALTRFRNEFVIKNEIALINVMYFRNFKLYKLSECLVCDL